MFDSDVFDSDVFVAVRVRRTLVNNIFQINDNDRYGCHCQMKDLVSQDYIDYQDGRDHFRYFGQPVDPLGKDSQKI